MFEVSYACGLPWDFDNQTRFGALVDREITFLYPFPLDAAAETVAMPFPFPLDVVAETVAKPLPFPFPPAEVVKYLYLPLPFPLTFPLTLVHEMYLMNDGALDGSADVVGSALGDADKDGALETDGAVERDGDPDGAVVVEGAEDVDGSREGILDPDGTLDSVGAWVGGIVGNALGILSSSNAIIGTKSTKSAPSRECLLEP